MQITKMLVPQSKYSIKCPYEMEAEGIAVHNTNNKASARAEASYMIGNNNKVSFHAVVDEEEVVLCIPFDRNAYHAGDGKNGRGNRKMIAIEICHSTNPDEEMFLESEKLAAEYIALILKDRGWGIDKVYKHQDFSGKYCPHKTLDLGWQRFLDIVQSYLEDKPIEKNNKESGSDEPVRTYINGSTSENVYADTSCTKKIGSLNPRESCDCFGIFNNKAMVRYQVGNTGNYKIGFTKWLGGVK